MGKENFEVELKVRLTKTQDVALKRFAKRKQSFPATQARVAIQDMLMREDEQYASAYRAEHPDEFPGESPETIVPFEQPKRTADYYGDESIAAGHPAGASTASPPTKITIPDDFPHKVDFVVRVFGDSMKRVANDGDRAAFIKAWKAKSGDIVAALSGGVLMLKMYEEHGKKQVLVSANPKYPPIPFNREAGDRIQGIFIDVLPNGGK